MMQVQEEKLTPEQFVYWLQGFLEIENPTSLGAKQTTVIKDHLALVFKKVTPDYIVTTNTTSDASGIYCVKTKNEPTFIC